MSALPLISHHLFVAAIDEPDNSQPKAVEASGHDNAIDLEILDWTDPVLDSAVRPARISPGSNF